MPEPEKVLLGETAEDLQAIAIRENLDCGYGEFDVIITAILASRKGMSPDEFEEKFTWQQEGLTDPIFITPR